MLFSLTTPECGKSAFYGLRKDIDIRFNRFPFEKVRVQDEDKTLALQIN